MAEGIGAAILGWLRAGYPEGVPAKDYFPLLALLRRTLSAAEFEGVIDVLAERHVSPVGDTDIRAAIGHVTSEPPAEQDVRAVAARLAAAGWPLSGGAQRWAAEPAASDPRPDAVPDAVLDPDPGVPQAPSVIERILAWFRLGYPEGIPIADYVPLLAVLRRRLSDEEVGHIADRLVAQNAVGGDVSHVDARVLASKVLDDLPSEDDLRRVEERLAAAGLVLD
ncbi:MAG: DUF3349 domain-containing protein [Microbacterium sp.]